MPICYVHDDDKARPIIQLNRPRNVVSSQALPPQAVQNNNAPVPVHTENDAASVPPRAPRPTR